MLITYGMYNNKFLNLQFFFEYMCYVWYLQTGLNKSCPKTMLIPDKSMNCLYLSKLCDVKFTEMHLSTYLRTHVYVFFMQMAAMLYCVYLMVRISVILLKVLILIIESTVSLMH